MARIGSRVIPLAWVSPPSALGQEPWLGLGPDRLDGVKAGSGGSGHGLVAAFQVVEHRRVGAGGFAAPVDAGFEQAAAAPAVDGADADA